MDKQTKVTPNPELAAKIRALLMASAEAFDAVHSAHLRDEPEDAKLYSMAEAVGANPEVRIALFPIVSIEAGYMVDGEWHPFFRYAPKFQRESMN